MVGFDPAKGRFSTYARPYAKKEMTAAVGGYTSPALDPQHKHKITATIEEIGSEGRDPGHPLGHPDPVARLLALATEDRWGYRSPDGSYQDQVFRFLTSRMGLPARCPGLGSVERDPAEFGMTWAIHHYKSKPPSPEKTAAKPRNYLKDPITASELANRNLYCRVCYLTLETYTKLAKRRHDGLDQRRR